MVTGDCFYVSEDPRSCIVEQRVDFAEFALDAREGIFDGRKIADVAFETVSIVQFTFNGCEGGSMTRKERGPVTGFNEASRKCCAVSWACARYHGDPFFSFCISNSSLSTSAPATSKETRRSCSTPPPAG